VSEVAEVFYPGLLAEIYAKFQSESVSRQDIMVLIETGRVDRWKILGGIADEVGTAKMLRPVLRRLLQHEGYGYVLKPRSTSDGDRYIVSRENLNNRPVNANIRLGDDDDPGIDVPKKRGGARPGAGRKPSPEKQAARIAADTAMKPDGELNALIDRILQRQERRTPGYVLRSQAMQRVLVRLDTALEGDDATLRAEVAAVIEDLGSVIHWEY